MPFDSSANLRGRAVTSCRLRMFFIGIAGVALLAPGLAQAQYFRPFRAPVYEYDEPPPRPYYPFRRGMLRPGEAVALVRQNGFRQVAAPALAGDVYRIDATDEDGVRVRLTVDAYLGDIVGGRVIGRAEHPPREAALQERPPAPPSVRPAPRNVPLPPASALPIPPRAEEPPPGPPVAVAPVPEDRHETLRSFPRLDDSARTVPQPPAEPIPQPRAATSPAEAPVATLPKSAPPKSTPLNSSTPEQKGEAAAKAVPLPPKAAVPAKKPEGPARNEAAIITAPNSGLGTGTADAPRKIEITPPALLDDAPQRKDTAPINSVPVAPLE